MNWSVFGRVGSVRRPCWRETPVLKHVHPSAKAPASLNVQLKLAFGLKPSHPAPGRKIRFFPKNAIFAIFGIFGCWSFRLQKNIEIVKNVKIFKNKLFTSQRCFQIPIMTFYDHYIQFYVKFKISRTCQFQLKRAKMPQMGKNAIF